MARRIQSEQPARAVPAVPVELQGQVVVETWVKPSEVKPADPRNRYHRGSELVPAWETELDAARYMAHRRHDDARWQFIDAHRLSQTEAAELLPSRGWPVFADERAFVVAMARARRGAD